MINLFETIFLGALFVISVLAARKKMWGAVAFLTILIAVGLNMIKRKGNGALWNPVILTAKVKV